MKREKMEGVICRYAGEELSAGEWSTKTEHRDVELSGASSMKKEDCYEDYEQIECGEKTMMMISSIPYPSINWTTTIKQQAAVKTEYYIDEFCGSVQVAGPSGGISDKDGIPTQSARQPKESPDWTVDTQESTMTTHTMLAINRTGDMPLKSLSRGKTYACNECNFSSRQSFVLKVHRRIHTGEKPFSCSKCNYKARQSGTFARHVRIHTGVKPFACRECNYSSADSSNLRRHVRSHKMENPISCSKCDFTCRVARTLKRHLKKIHDEEPNKFTDKIL